MPVKTQIGADGKMLMRAALFALLALVSSVASTHVNGEAACQVQGRGEGTQPVEFTQTECEDVGCCHWNQDTDDGQGACWSSVGTDVCSQQATGCCVQFYGDDQANVCDSCVHADATCRDSIIKFLHPDLGVTMYQVSDSRKDCIVFELNTTTTTDAPTNHTIVSHSCPDGFQFVGSETCVKEVPNDHTLQQHNSPGGVLGVYAPVPSDSKYVTKLQMTMPYPVEEFMTMQEDFKEALSKAATMDEPFSGRTEIVHIEEGRPREYHRRDEKGGSDHVHVHVEFRTTSQTKIEEIQTALGDETDGTIFTNIEEELANAGITGKPMFPVSVIKYSSYPPVEEEEVQEVVVEE